MLIPQQQIIRLTSNKIMEYDWGSTSKQCLIHELTNKQCKRYAQLWMGTHKNGPSLLQDKKSLADYLKQRNIKDLPFLFKVLCIQKALSIQLHPNKQQAQRLFNEKPGLYQDDNEKPQMFYTLTEFQCFFGIIDHEQLTSLCNKYPFTLLKTRHTLSIKKMIEELSHLPIQGQIYMIDRLIKDIDSIAPDRKDIIFRLQKQFPYDVGILVSCLLKYRKLDPGQCYAIDAGVPHAYLKGSCLQIMKNSDNVVRLGLTPKMKDISTLIEIMNETVGLDGIKVVKSPQGYTWNGLIIQELQNSLEVENQIQIKHLSIGIVFSKKFIAQQQKLEVEKGQVLFFTSGKYHFKGPYRMFLGSYASN